MSKIVNKIKMKGKKIVKAILPSNNKYNLEIPPVGHVDLGHLRRLTPIDPHFGYSRGQVIDRYYIDKFLEEMLTLLKAACWN